MVSTRRSPAEAPNRQLREEKPKSGERNRAWLSRLGDADGIILIGGTSVADFRVRVAQSALRNDMHPSHWSMCGILLAGGIFASVPLDVPDAAALPNSNGVQMCRLDDYDDPKRYPNIAIIRFAEAHRNVHRDIARVQGDRSIIELPAMVLSWLGFVWGTSGSTNPLMKAIGLPSAAFVESVFAMAGFELTPGLSSASSCPEAIWQSAKWWADYYEGAVIGAKEPAADGAGQAVEEVAALPMVPKGSFTIRQTSAAVME
jgi:hypothetical protein